MLNGIWIDGDIRFECNNWGSIEPGTVKVPVQISQPSVGSFMKSMLLASENQENWGVKKASKLPVTPGIH